MQSPNTQNPCELVSAAVGCRRAGRAAGGRAEEAGGKAGRAGTDVSLPGIAVKSQCPKEPGGHLVYILATTFLLPGRSLWQCPHKWWLKLGTRVSSDGVVS